MSITVTSEGVKRQRFMAVKMKPMYMKNRKSHAPAAGRGQCGLFRQVSAWPEDCLISGKKDTRRDGVKP